MKIRIFMLLLCVSLHLVATKVIASEGGTTEMDCPSGVAQDSNGVCSEPGGIISPAVPEGSHPLQPQQSKQEDTKDVQKDFHRTKLKPARQPADSNKKIIVYFYWGRGCPHCEEEKTFLADLKRALPSLEIRDYEVWYNHDNAGLMEAMLRAYGMRSSGVPVTVINDRVFTGFTAQSMFSIEKAIKECSIRDCGDPGDRLRKIDQEQAPQSLPFGSGTTATVEKMETDPSVNIPFFGPLDARSSSLPVLTLVIAGMDSFNPCAFFVLLSLLGLLVHAQSRNKMLLIGGIFVFISGFIYFLFMAAWLNLFLIMGHVEVITTIAGCVSVAIAAINIKDFFLFKQGVSLSIPDSAKPKLFDRMRKLVHSSSLVSLAIGTTVLAIVANFYELLCTAGFPMVFTRILTLNKLTTSTYYLYLVLYNFVYVVPLFLIVLGFTFTLGRRKLSEWQGRFLKLVSGVMMLGLGAVLLTNPALMNNVLVSLIILISALGGSLLVAMVMRRWGDVAR